MRKQEVLEIPQNPPAIVDDGKPGAPDNLARAAAPGSPAGVYRRTVRFAFAADAPIIVGTGRANPIELGAEVPYEQSGHTLHMWDWSKSGVSRVMKDVRLWPDDEFVLSPDGRLLVWAKGDILDLTTGERSKVDLGGEFHLDKLPRIEHLQFAPDGKRLALFVSNLVLTKSAHPLRHEDVSAKETVQIVEFPAGRLVCEFPAEAPAELQAAFSADGRRFVSQYAVGKSGRKIVERRVQTGQVVREYEPHLREFASAMDWSADGKRLAVFDAAGEILLWDTGIGALKHKISKVYHSMEYLRFSPDGKLLAYSSLHLGSPKLFLIDVESGMVIGSLPQKNAGNIHWSRDGKSIEVIATGNSIAERPGVGGGLAVYNVFPLVETFKVDDFPKK
jgi:WD40 repeat protein